MKYDGMITIATGNSRRSTNWKNKEMLWSDFVDKLGHVTRTQETQAEYARMSKDERDNAKDVGGFVGGTLKGGRRKINAVTQRRLITLDMDSITADEDPWPTVTLILGCAAVLFSTHSHTPKTPRLRLVIPLSRPVTPEEYEAIARRIAGDIGVGGREIGFMYGQYKRLKGLYEGVLTGKGLTWGGSLVRTQATGYGLVYILDAMLKDHKIDLAGKTVVVSGSGNVAIYATEKAQQLGAKVVAMSDSNGYIYDANGINLDVVKDIKEVRRGRIKEYADAVPGSVYTEGKGIWSIKCDIALPCATQNELNLDDAKTLKANGCVAVAEGANMPSTREATDFFLAEGMLFLPGKASNAGGVGTSALEMCQNSQRLSWTFEEVDAKLKQMMNDIYAKISDAAKRYGVEGNYVTGANIAGFEKVADAMMAQGIVL